MNVNFERLTGCTIVIVTEDGEYEGVLKLIIPETKQISLSNVVMLPKRLPLCGSQNFFEQEIKTYHVIKQAKNSCKKEPKLSSIIDGELVESSVAHVNDGGILEDDSGSDRYNHNEALIEECFLKVPKNLSQKLPKDVAVISEIDNDFYDAICYIGGQGIIGASFHGLSIGRSGELSIIGISTNICTFLFDICALKMKAFENGLKRIFEATHVKKVIHNCQQPSDCLFHQYNTRLNGVHDTLLTDVFIRMQDRPNGKLPLYTNKLGDCLSQYLKLSDNYIYNAEISEAYMKIKFTLKKCLQRIYLLSGVDVTLSGLDIFLKSEFISTYNDIYDSRLQLYQGDFSEWKQRPISSHLKDAVIKSTIYLKELQNVLHDKMLQPYASAVELYLSHARDANLEEIELEPAFSHRLPQEMRSLQIRSVKYDDFEKKGIEKRERKMRNHQMPFDQFVQNFELHCKKEIPVTEPLPCAVSNDSQKKYSCSLKRRSRNQTHRVSINNSLECTASCQSSQNQIQTSVKQTEECELSTLLSSSKSSTTEESDVSNDKAVSPTLWPNIPSTFSSKAQLIPAGMECSSRYKKNKHL